MFNWKWEILFLWQLIGILLGFVALIFSEQTNSLWPGVIWLVIMMSLAPYFIKKARK